MSDPDCLSNAVERINQFALVSYIPDPLGRFLDGMRLHLVPECRPHAHVTILPPRPLCGAPEQAAREIREIARGFQPFSIRLGGLSKFPVSDVIHVEIASGADKLLEMYRRLNAGASTFCEKFPYAPHITVAQCLPPERVDSVFEEARAIWRACPCERSFRVDVLSFVQNTVSCRWIDLEDIELAEPPPPLPPLTQRDPAAHLRQA
jgi:2'-5' RNA ligase